MCDKNKMWYVMRLKAYILLDLGIIFFLILLEDSLFFIKFTNYNQKKVY